MRIIIAGIVAGFVIFIWGYISWMVLPWHDTVINRWSSEQSVVDTLSTNSPVSGIYFAPVQYDTASSSDISKSPLVFASIQRKGVSSSMWVQSLVALFADIVAACIVAWLLFRTSNLGFFMAVSFVTVFGIAAGIATYIPYMIWWGFGMMYTAVQTLDLVVAWYFAGVVLALFYRTSKNA